ncbi:BolA family protein [Altererythrobacter lutimaris]|uniref:BolA family transcriptional regulator n=1 Tax=Altererythrobacter lutimaris TaxID=2743979 RepID=A0A850H9Z3_9SPHN|nr:BolA family protein [Altererythrobacter lutimaris]NVE94549.1 BolA family transcriptional regulator [Altererythrobacter lutimaris]
MTGPMAQEIESRLREAFTPTQLDIINDSAKHRGHSGDDGSGESHFTIVIEAEAFAAMNRLGRQRAVIEALGDIVGERVHAVAIKAKAPGE